MSGTLAHASEVARGGDDSGTEMVVPEPVDLTRAVSGFSGSESQFAKAVLRPVD